MKEFLTKNKRPLLVALIVVIVRWIYVVQLSGQPGFTVPMVDEDWHWQWALSIIHGPFFGSEAWFRAPLYPYFLALLAFVTGKSILWSKLLQVVVCGGTAFFLYKLADKLVGRRAALLSGLIYAVYGTLLYYEAMFLIPVVFLFFTVWGMYRLVAYSESQRPATWLVTGIVFGLAAISRPNILLVVPVLMLWVWLALDRARPLIARLRRPILIGLGLLIPIVPVTIRNLAVTGDFILISSQGGINFYLGNNPVATGLAMRMPEVDLSEDLPWSRFQPATTAAAEREVGHPLTAAEASSFWTGKAVSWITHNPGSFLRLAWQRLVYLASGFENSDNSDIYWERGKSVLYAGLLWHKIIAFPFGLLLPFALAGVYLRRKDTRRLLPIYLFLVVYTPTIILFLVTARHRLPLVPFLIVLAAAAVVSLFDLIGSKNLKKLGIAAVIIVAGLLVFNRTYYREGGSNDFQIHFSAGIKQERLGNYTAAEKEYALAARYYPYSPSLLTNLGHAQFVLNKLEAAERNYRRALSINPHFHRALNDLGQLVEKRGRLDSARVLFHRAAAAFDPDAANRSELSRIYLNLAGVFEQTKQDDSAVVAFDSALSIGPTIAKGFYQASSFYARKGNYGLSDSLFTEARKHGGPSPVDCFNYAVSMMQRKRYAGAIKWLMHAVTGDSTLFQGWYLIGVSMYEQGAPPDSVLPYLDWALYLNPSYQPAIELKKQLEGKPPTKGAGG